MDTQTRSNGLQAPNAYTALPTLSEPPVWAAAEGYEIREVARRTPTTDVFLTYHRPTGTFRELIVVQHMPGVDHGALREAIEAEVAAVRGLSHVGIAPIEDVGLTRNGCVYVATARPVGRPLNVLLAEDGRLPVLRAFELGHMLVTALAVAHERGIVHGWLTPDSVIVVPPRAGWPERVVVLGFGTAAAQAAGLRSGAFSAEQLPYASPERAAGGPPSGPSDVFSLGSLLLRMLVGSTPSVVHAAYGEVAPDEDGRQPGDIEHLLRRARAVDPARRFPTARELGTALWTVHNAWFASQADERAQAAPLVVADANPGRRRALVAAGVLGVLAAGGGARLWSGRGTTALESPLTATAQPVAQAAPSAVVPSAVVPSAAVPPTPVPSAPVPSAPALAAPTEHRVDTVSTRSVPPPVQQRALVEPPSSGAASPSAPKAAAAPATVTSNSGGDVDATRSPATRVEPAGSAALVVADAVTATAGTSEAERGYRASQVWEAVADYGTAIGARDLKQLERIYPEMTEPQRRGWTAFFNAVTDLRAPMTIEQITTSGATAQVRVRAAYEYENLRPHRAERSVVNYTVTLVRDGAGWRIRAVE